MEELTEGLLKISPIIFIIIINIVLSKSRSKGVKKVQEEPRRMEAPQRIRQQVKLPPKKKDIFIKQQPIRPSLSQSLSLVSASETSTEGEMDEEGVHFFKEALIYSEIIGKPLALREDV